MWKLQVPWVVLLSLPYVPHFSISSPSANLCNCQVMYRAPGCPAGIIFLINEMANRVLRVARLQKGARHCYFIPWQVLIRCSFHDTLSLFFCSSPFISPKGINQSWSWYIRPYSITCLKTRWKTIYRIKLPTTPSRFPDFILSPLILNTFKPFPREWTVDFLGRNTLETLLYHRLADVTPLSTSLGRI